MTKNTQPYRGRFAPSPSGKLHFGSLVAAIGSYLEAKSNQGKWLVRIEDIDEARTVAGSAESIYSTLENFGFEWDEQIIYQSHRIERYRYYLSQLTTEKLVYPCDCSRNKLRADNTGNIYPGYCRNKAINKDRPHALRCKTKTVQIEFNDLVQGNYAVNLESECGDFIIKRRDGFFAYQLAVVVDDAEQGITDIVRGADLLDTTPQQIYLQELLEFTTPSYAHLPIVMHDNGIKLSKSHQDLPLNHLQPTEIMTSALNFLNQSPPIELSNSTLDEFWFWAEQNWDIKKVPTSKELNFNL